MTRPKKTERQEVRLTAAQLSERKALATQLGKDYTATDALAWDMLRVWANATKGDGKPKQNA